MGHDTPAPPISPVAQYMAKGFIGLCSLFTVCWTAIYFVPGLALVPVALAVNTSPFCSLRQTVRDAQVKVDQARDEEHLMAGIRLLRTEGHLKLWATPQGEYWVPGSSDRILGILLAQQRRKIYGDAETGGVRSGDIVLDAGAHVGTYVRTALDAGAAKVVAIDPSPEAVECLRRNFRREVSDGRVIVYPKGVWDEEKALILFSNGNGAAGDSFVAASTAAQRIDNIPVTTVDRIVAELGLPRVDLIKADVKGAAERMLDGAAGTISKFHPRIVISTEEAPEDPSRIASKVKALSADYQFRCGPCLFNGDEIRTDVVFFQ
jgi:FkbM family methyltransferase